MAARNKKHDRDSPSKAGKKSASSSDEAGKKPEKMKNKEYEEHVKKLQGELVKLQLWVQHAGLRVVIVFEGRDTAGKGGVIKAITERVSPRVFRIVALPAPTEREKSQLYIQRYLTHFPAAGEVILFDRISEEEQQRRFESRIDDPRKIWKLSPMDVKAAGRWYDYSRARDDMLQATDTQHAPWYVVDSNDQRRARLNCITHLLSLIPYKEIKRDKIKLPKRQKRKGYVEPERTYRHVPQVY